MTNQELIHTFYESFAKGDVAGMIACYHQDIEFSDPAFGTLHGDDARNMWRMLISRNSGAIEILFKNVESNEKFGAADWRATYIFSQTGRKVVNHISAEFEFHDGKIIKHTDTFNMYWWSCQALGWRGYLLGWTPFMKQKIREQTTQLLRKFTQKQGAA